jgi:arginase
LGDILCTPRHALAVGNPKLKYLEEIVRVSEAGAKKVFAEVKKKKRIIVLGGDHSVSLGAISGASAAVKGDVGLLYFDAHGDMNTDTTTQTGNIHGMHLASLMGFGDARLTSVYNDSIKIAKENLLHIGGNDFDEGELALLEQEHLQVFRIFDVLSHGLAPLFRMIDSLQSRVKHVWVSIDLDVIDSVYAPGAGMPNKAGLTYREITAVAEYIGRHCSVMGLDIVEYNPLQDIEGKTAELGIELIAKLLGVNYSWYTNYLEKNRLK